MLLECQLDNSWDSWSTREELKLVKKSINAIDEVVPPTTKTELQSLLGKIHFKFVRKSFVVSFLVEVEK